MPMTPDEQQAHLQAHLEESPEALGRIRTGLLYWEAALFRHRSVDRIASMIQTGDWPCNPMLLDALEAAERALRVWHRILLEDEFTLNAVSRVANRVSLGKVLPSASDLPRNAA